MLENFLIRVAKKVGYSLEKQHGKPSSDIAKDIEFMTLYEQCRPYTMTSIERLYSLYQSVNYIIDNEVPGDFVECGVWRGGSSMMMALTLLRRNQAGRKIYLYDTFEGMSEPTEADTTFYGENASDLLKKQDVNDAASIWCYSSIEEVRKNVGSISYPQEKLIFVKGKVEDTLSEVVPGEIALLRLDTDWYESTLKELEVLYPVLVEKGVLIIDDFGHWEGAKKAVLEYFEKEKPLLHRIDNTGRIMIK